jgi:hypothetical protein
MTVKRANAERPIAALEDALTAALRRSLAKERDPRARAWLRGLIDGDKPVKAKEKAKKRPRRKAA